MEKIRLNDGTVLDIQSGATEYAVVVIAASVDEVAKQFTDANLERFEILTEDNSVCAIYTKKHLKKLSAEVTEEGYLVTIVLEDVNELYERIKSLEEKVEILEAEKVADEEPEIETEEIQPEIIEDSTNDEVIEEPAEEPTEAEPSEETE